jgi:hypothetical protein
VAFSFVDARLGVGDHEAAAHRSAFDPEQIGNRAGLAEAHQAPLWWTPKARDHVATNTVLLRRVEGQLAA